MSKIISKCEYTWSLKMVDLKFFIMLLIATEKLMEPGSEGQKWKSVIHPLVHTGDTQLLSFHS